MQFNKQQRGASRLLVIGSLLLAALLLAGIVVGPVLLDYYRFDKAVALASQQAEARGGAWPQLDVACTQCHGVGGNPQSQLYPHLAGQPAAYLSGQLHAFASGQRSNPQMSSLAINLSPREIEQLASFFAAQPVLPNNYFTPDPQQQALGEQLIKVGNCSVCHGAQLQGQAAFPRLAGQSYDYLIKQLNAFKSGARIDSTGAMATAVAPLSEQEIVSIATYLASQTGAEHAQ